MRAGSTQSLGIFLSLVFVMCAAVTLATRQTGPKGLISFEVPAGWSNDRFKNGRHFTRDAKPDDPNILGVVPEQRDKYMTREKMSDGRKRVNELQGHHQILDRMTSIDGFEVWEGVFEGSIRGQDVVLHTFLLFSDSLMIDVHLNASKSVYDTYLVDLRNLVASIRVTDAGRKLGTRDP